VSPDLGTPDALYPVMMMKILPLTALALGLSSGVALADRGHGDQRGNDHRGSVVVRDHRGGGGDSHRGTTTVVQRGGGYNNNRVVVREPRYVGYHGGYHNNSYGYRSGGYQAVRRPIFVSRPVIRERYFNYYRRPALIVENYNSMPGYYWVPGAWTWSGAEWVWQQGHYQPDPNAAESYYDGY
jgi:hypothetical protein